MMGCTPDIKRCVVPPSWHTKASLEHENKMTKENQRGTIGIWINSQKYKRFATSCKLFGFEICEILEDFMDEFVSRYPPEDPNQIQFIQAPAWTKVKPTTPNIREELAEGLLKWMSVFICPGCGAYRHLTTENWKYLEKQGIRPSCPKCGKHMIYDSNKEVLTDDR
jgi:hypothetical protein